MHFAPFYINRLLLFLVCFSLFSSGRNFSLFIYSVTVLVCVCPDDNAKQTRNTVYTHTLATASESTKKSWEINKNKISVHNYNSTPRARAAVGASEGGGLPGVGGAGGGLHGAVDEGVAVVHEQHPLPPGALGPAGGRGAVRQGGLRGEEPHGDAAGKPERRI